MTQMQFLRCLSVVRYITVRFYLLLIINFNRLVEGGHNFKINLKLIIIIIILCQLLYMNKSSNNILTIIGNEGQSVIILPQKRTQ